VVSRPGGLGPCRARQSSSPARRKARTRKRGPRSLPGRSRTASGIRVSIPGRSPRTLSSLIRARLTLSRRIPRLWISSTSSPRRRPSNKLLPNRSIIGPTPTAINSLRILLLMAAVGAAQVPGAVTVEREMLSRHNAVRARAGVLPLRWSQRLAAQAQDWADELIARGRFFHRPATPFGENIFEIRGASAAPAQVVDDWAAESHDYDYASNTCADVCGHFTQIVWAGTKEVGCGVARNAFREVWVCNYDPPGNIVGRRPW